MKKLLISSLLIFSLSTAYSQVKFGFKATPTISYNRVDSGIDSLEFNTEGAALRFQLGPIFDFEFKENHYFSTGLLFASKRAAFSTSADTAIINSSPYNMHYLQVPLTLKLYTEEVGLDKQIYFQFGGTVDFKTKGEGDVNEAIQTFNFADATALLAIGLEYGIGINTKLFAGLRYQRGLFNIVNENAYGEDWALRNDLVGLELGIKF